MNNSNNLSDQKYEKRWKHYLRHTHQQFLEQIETSEQDMLLDVSAGTGLLAKKLIANNYPFKHLIANDPSGEMLTVARNRLQEAPRISFTNYHADRLPFRKNMFDRIFCLNAFHCYNNQQQVLDIIHNMLTPSGRFYLLDWNRSGFFSYVNGLIDWMTSEYIDTRSRSELVQMLQKSGFQIRFTRSWNWWYWKFLFVEAKK